MASSAHFAGLGCSWRCLLDAYSGVWRLSPSRWHVEIAPRSLGLHSEIAPRSLLALRLGPSARNGPDSNSSPGPDPCAFRGTRPGPRTPGPTPWPRPATAPSSRLLGGVQDPGCGSQHTPGRSPPMELLPGGSQTPPSDLGGGGILGRRRAILGAEKRFPAPSSDSKVCGFPTA